MLAFCSSLNLEGQTTVSFPYNGSVQTFNVPTGITSLTVKIWGAGGAGGYFAAGGTGAYVTGTLTVTSGQTLTLLVGQGGQIPTSTTTAYAYGGGGKGGYVSSYVGGGGGSNYNTSAAAYPHGGGGGATSGWDSSAASATTYAGKLGTTSAGGAAGNTGSGTAPTAGAPLVGG